MVGVGTAVDEDAHRGAGVAAAEATQLAAGTAGGRDSFGCH